jgi:hypothetical protein
MGAIVAGRVGLIGIANQRRIQIIVMASLAVLSGIRPAQFAET